MKRSLWLVSIMLGFTLLTGASNYTQPASPVATPSSIPVTGSSAWFSSLSMKEVQKLAGRKLTLKEKIGVKIFQWKIKRIQKIAQKKPGSRKGQVAKVFGIIGLSSLIVPVIGPFAALICLILALVLGYEARKADPNDKNAKTAIILGWVTLGVMLLVVALLVAILSSMTLFSFG